MWLWFVIIGIVVIFFVAHSIYYGDDFGEIFISIIGGATAGAIICVLLGFFIGALLCTNKNIMMDNVESNSEIIALTDNTQTYIYRSVDSSNNIRYNYMIETNRGYLTQSIMANRAYIIETNDKTPSVETHRVIYKSEFLRKHFFNDNTRYYYIYVPEGTIVGGFNIDLQ